LKALSYSGGIVHHHPMAGIQASRQVFGIVDLTRAPRVRARPHARVAANFANFGGGDGD
jgi:hypothetical protein